MKIIDLTHTMHGEMPVFPGTEKPIFYPVNTLEKDGFIETKLSLYSHTGTHIDAPSHMLQGAKTLDKLQVDNFVGRGIVLDFTNIEGKEITKEALLKYEKDLKEVDFLLLMTGWDQYWNSDKYFDGFPSLTLEGAEWLVRLGLKGIGIDAISIDDMNTTTFDVHYKLFQHNMIVIENLTNLTSIYGKSFIFSCLPLKYQNADGSPVRAIAMELD